MGSLRSRVIEFLLGIAMRPNLHPRLNVRGLRLIDALKPPFFVNRSKWSGSLAGGIQVFTYQDKNTDVEKSPLVFLHGGAHVSGPHAGHYQMLAALCRRTQRRGLMPIFRLAPEHPFPAGFDDIHQLLDTLTTGYLLVGDSAGGGLAISVAYDRATRGLTAPAKVAAFAPWLDVEISHPDCDQIPDRVLTRVGLKEAGTIYAGNTPPADPRVSPLYADTSKLPPLLIDVGTHDLFLPDCRAFIERARSSGLQVSYHEEPGAFHVYAGVYPFTPESIQSIQRAGDFLR